MLQFCLSLSNEACGHRLSFHMRSSLEWCLTACLRVAHVSSEDQLVDALTKPLSCSRFQSLKINIGISKGA